VARPRSRSADPDPTLFADAPAPPFRRGRHERSADASIRTARKSGLLTHDHDALASLIRALARSLDLAERTDQPYAVAQVGRELRACLVEARLVPAQVADPVDPLTAFLASVADDAPATT
jgi:hypothetical protein